ncbi:MAG: alpha-L-arabinofuranosidase C-terminal domain-containing protein [Candidatus Poribacteria bacterium]
MRLYHILIIPLFFVALIGCSKTPISAESTFPDGISASVKVTDSVLNTVNPLIFGDNIEWVNDGMGVWIPKENRFDDEIVKEFKALGITHLRYPGGTLSDYFDWHNAIGKGRKPITNPFRDYKREYPYFGPDEFMELCRKLGIPGTITFNAGTGKPEDAVKWAEYIKKANFNVTAFAVGNEIYLANPSEPLAKTAEQYIDFFLKCKEGLDKVAPDIKLGIIGIHDSRYMPIKGNRNWMRDVLTALGDKIDFIDVHNGYAPILRGVGLNPNRIYPDDDFALCFMGASVHVQKDIENVKQDLARYAPGRNIELHITEYGPLVYPLKKERAVEDVAWNRSLAGALYLACLYNVFLKEPKLALANHLPLCQDIFGALIGIRGTYPNRKLWRNIVYYVFQSYSAMANRDSLETIVQCPTYSVPAMGLISKLENVPYIDVGAYRRKDGKELTLFLINRSVKNKATVEIDTGFGRFKINSTIVLTSNSYKDENSPDEPNKVVPIKKTGDNNIYTNAFNISLPKHSLTIIVLSRFT